MIRNHELRYRVALGPKFNFVDVYDQKIPMRKFRIIDTHDHDIPVLEFKINDTIELSKNMQREICDIAEQLNHEFAMYNNLLLEYLICK